MSLCVYILEISRPSVRRLPMGVPQRFSREYRNITGPLPASRVTGYTAIVSTYFSNDNGMLHWPSTTSLVLGPSQTLWLTYTKGHAAAAMALSSQSRRRSLPALVMYKYD